MASCSSCSRICEAALLQITASRDQEIPLCGGELAGELLLDMMRQRQIDVVTSEEQVIAYGDTFDVGNR